MTQEEILALLKVDLGIFGSAYDDYLKHLISTAGGFIEKEGIHLQLEDQDDVHLLIMYAAFLFRKRATDEGMPRSLRWALNNRLFGGGTNVTG